MGGLIKVETGKYHIVLFHGSLCPGGPSPISLDFHQSIGRPGLLLAFQWVVIISLCCNLVYI